MWTNLVILKKTQCLVFAQTYYFWAKDGSRTITKVQTDDDQNIGEKINTRVKLYIILRQKQLLSSKLHQIRYPKFGILVDSSLFLDKRQITFMLLLNLNFTPK